MVGLKGWVARPGFMIYTQGRLEIAYSATIGHDDFICLWMGADIIVTLSDNDSTLTIWDKSNGEKLAGDLHKAKE